MPAKSHPNPARSQPFRTRFQGGEPGMPHRRTRGRWRVPMWDLEVFIVGVAWEKWRFYGFFLWVFMVILLDVLEFHETSPTSIGISATKIW